MVVRGTEFLANLRAWKHWTLLKWSLMAAAVFWMLVYGLSEAAAQIPEFVYVNF